MNGLNILSLWALLRKTNNNLKVNSTGLTRKKKLLKKHLPIWTNIVATASRQLLPLQKNPARILDKRGSNHFNIFSSYFCDAFCNLRYIERLVSLAPMWHRGHIGRVGLGHNHIQWSIFDNVVIITSKRDNPCK